ncbi:MAG: MFS transporter, partial [Acidimicrobiales bacterium]
VPMAAMTVVVSPISGWLVGRFGARPSLVVGGAAIALGSALLTGITVHTSFAHLFVAYVVFGLGFGAVNPPITNTAVSGMPASQAGVASAVTSASRQVGQSIGVAVVGAISAVGLAGGALGRSFALASHGGWWVLAGAGVFVVVIGVVSTTRGAMASAERAAELFDT